MSNAFAENLLSWFDKFGRQNLPWQQNISPYRVWISEIMLQQTQVATVIPYFEKFISHFPNIKTLADASLDTVLHLWTGLGYYARARNIHKAANIIVTEHHQIFPSDLSMLISLPGIGRSTAGAILSIAFQKPSPILDGNVKRVLTRYHAISGYPGDKSVENKLWAIADQNTPKLRCADYTQAIMDLGATVCIRSRPHCELCPLQATCTAYNENRTSNFPQPKKKTPLPIKNTSFLILKNDRGEIYLEKRPLVGIWGGLWGFPECKTDDVIAFVKHKFNCQILSHQIGEPFRHTFSHFHLEIIPIHIRIKVKPQLKVSEADSLWCLPMDLPKIGLSAPIKKLLQSNKE